MPLAAMKASTSLDDGERNANHTMPATIANGTSNHSSITSPAPPLTYQCSATLIQTVRPVKPSATKRTATATTGSARCRKGERIGRGGPMASSGGWPATHPPLLEGLLGRRELLRQA